MSPLEESCPGALSATLVEVRSVELDRCLTTFLASGLGLVRRASIFGFALVEEGGRAWDCTGLGELTGVALELEKGAGAVDVEERVAVLVDRVGVRTTATGAGSGLRPGFGLAGGLTGCGWASAEPAPSKSSPVQSIPSQAAIRSRLDGNLSTASLRRPRNRAVRFRRTSPTPLASIVVADLAPIVNDYSWRESSRVGASGWPRAEPCSPVPEDEEHEIGDPEEAPELEHEPFVPSIACRDSFGSGDTRDRDASSIWNLGDDRATVCSTWRRYQARNSEFSLIQM